ncbi:MAG TPA: AAA family ATPase [Planctomycetaceae bacterium]|nr:AAA family ATPase [Planctomycetaceae bacterium]
MPLANTLAEYIRAAFSGLYIETQEPAEALRELADLCRQEQWTLATWDIDQGLRLVGGANTVGTAATDPLAALRSLPALATSEGTTLLVLSNFHRFLNSAEIVQALQHQLLAGKANRTFVVILAPVVQMPAELERQFVVLTHDLPHREQLAQIAHELAPETPRTGAAWDALLDAAAGLTRYEAEGAFALSLARHDALRPVAVWELKAQTLRKQNLLTLSRTADTFASLGGLAALKEFCRRALQPGRSVTARGTLLLSPPGCGKSAFCRALGQEVGRPVLKLDIGRLMGSLVGESERNIRQALAIADAMAPAILFVDELEKGLSGVNGSGDSGVSTRLFGTLLTWLAEHESDVFFIGTANDIRRLPPEFTRAERLDAVFFVDLPGAEQRQQIWSLYRRQHDVPASQPTPADEGWTGAEIKSCCRLAALLDVSLTKAARNVVPVSITAAEAVDQLRDWASGRCLSADQPGIYQKPAVAPVRRKVTTASPN